MRRRRCATRIRHARKRAGGIHDASTEQHDIARQLRNACAVKLADHVDHVVEFEQDRLIGWEPVVFSYENPEYEQSVGHPGLREWGWQLEPLGEDRTRVTAFFEGSRLPEELRKFIDEGEFWRPAMVTSLDNLERIVRQSNGGDQELPHSETATPFVELFRGT